jgi:predicted ATP-binding protein involved in virulence
MGSHTSSFKGEHQWTEPQITTKVDQVFAKYDTIGNGLDRETFGRWLQSEAANVSKHYSDKELDDAYSEVQKDNNGRIQKHQLNDYLRKVHTV